jgi:hypothetical protein
MYKCKAAELFRTPGGRLHFGPLPFIFLEPFLCLQ